MSAAAHSTNTVVVGGHVASLRRGLVEQLASRYREHLARTGEGELARLAMADEAWGRPANQGGGSRDLGATPLRGIRLT